MARNTLFSVVVSSVLALSAQAGEIKIHEWPTQYIPQEVATITVTMDVGFYVQIMDQDKLRIKLQQKAIREYEGCTEMTVRTNFDMTLSCTIAGTGAVPGDYSCSISPADVDSPGGTVTVCAKLKNADLISVPGGASNVHVATVTIKVVPR
jgi:hypothetical protein